MTAKISMNLRTALVEWRRAERQHAVSVLCAPHPARLSKQRDSLENALDKVRIIVDSEPWAEIAREVDEK